MRFLASSHIVLYCTLLCRVVVEPSQLTLGGESDGEINDENNNEDNDEIDDDDLEIDSSVFAFAETGKPLLPTHAAAFSYVGKELDECSLVSPPFSSSSSSNIL